MASPSESTASREDGPVMSLINKRLRALKKKLNRIHQMEESISQGKPINKEQEEVLKSKPFVLASIDELDKLRLPLSSALSQELSRKPEETPSRNEDLLEDLINLLYFGSLFDVKSPGEFRAVMFARTHERGCCLTYDYVSDDDTEILVEKDLDSISGLSGLLTSRAVDSGLSHRNALKRCVEHARLWLAGSDQPISPNSDVSYAGLKAKLNKIMASDYFTATPEMKGPVEVAAAVEDYASFEVPVHGVPVFVPIHFDSSAVDQVPQEDENASDSFQGHETSDNQSSPAEELQKDEGETESHGEDVSGDQEADKQLAEVDHIQRGYFEPKEHQDNSRRYYQNYRGVRGRGGGGRRAYPNGRGGRIGGRGASGYQNGRNQFYDEPGNYYPRNYYNNRGRGSRGGRNPYNNHVSSAQGGHAPEDVGVAS